LTGLLKRADVDRVDDALVAAGGLGFGQGGGGDMLHAFVVGRLADVGDGEAQADVYGNHLVLVVELVALHRGANTLAQSGSAFQVGFRSNDEKLLAADPAEIVRGFGT